MRRTLILLAGLLALTLADSSAQVRTPKTIMREKLENTQLLMEGVMAGDFDAMKRYGNRLARLTYVEINSWQESAPPDYLQHARSFVHAVQDFRAAAAASNYEQATSEFNRIVASCSECHTKVRPLAHRGYPPLSRPSTTAE